MQDNSDALDLGAYLTALRRHWLTVLLPLVLTVAATAAVTYTQTPIYSATAEAALEPVRNSDSAMFQDLILGADVISTEVRVLTSDTVTQRVIENLGIDASTREVAGKVEVAPVGGTRVVRISASDDDPEFAALLANTYATAYFDYRRDRALDEVGAARETLRERAQAIEQQLEQLDDEIDDAAASSLGAITEDDAQLRIERERLLEQLAQIENQLTTTGTSADDVRGGGELLVPASPPDSPVVPQPLRNLVLATVLGLFLGIALALLRDYLDDAIRGEADVKRATPGQPIVGRIREWDDDKANQKLITIADPFAGASEEFQAMAANVRFALVSRAGRHAAGTEDFAGRAVAVTSASQEEGKTTTAGNLAVAAAATGRRVILVGADLRKPTMARRFGLPDGQGLTDLLANAGRFSKTSDLAAYLIDVGVPRLRVLPCGTVPPNPTELLASGQMAWLHDELAGMADLVVYDTPPVLPVADTLEIAQHVDLTFIVVRNEGTHRRDLSHAVERLQGVGAELGGLVLNGVTDRRSGAYGYGEYGYGYRPQSEYRPRTQDADEADSDDAPASPATFSAVRVTTPPTTLPPDATSPAAATWDADETAAAAAPAVDSGADSVRRDDEPDATDTEEAPDEDVDLDRWLFRNR